MHGIPIPFLIIAAAVAVVALIGVAGGVTRRWRIKGERYTWTCKQCTTTGHGRTEAEAYRRQQTHLAAQHIGAPPVRR